MTEHEPPGPHVFQPFGCHDARWESGRIYAVGGVHTLATIQGLTKKEAEAVCVALRRLEEPRPTEPCECPVGHKLHKRGEPCPYYHAGKGGSS